MSFKINCYYLLKRKTIDSSTYGDISGPFSLNEILNIDPSFSQNPLSIIYDKIPPSNGHIVGIPQTNGNNISKNRIFFYMATYNIGALISIKPYESIGGNGTGEGAHEVCIDPANRKRLALLHNRNSIHPLTRHEKYVILTRGNINSYRHCINKA